MPGTVDIQVIAEALAFPGRRVFTVTPPARYIARLAKFGFDEERSTDPHWFDTAKDPEEAFEGMTP